MARTPFIGGLNLENVGKSIDAADKIPALSGSRSLDELKSTVGIMEKAPLAQERSAASVSGCEAGGVERQSLQMEANEQSFWRSHLSE